MRWLGAMGGFLGWLLWALHVRRGVVMGNLRLAFPEWTEARRRQVGRQTFLNLGRMAPEFLLASKLGPAELERMFIYDPGTIEARCWCAPPTSATSRTWPPCTT
jgi:KDO2-lipid IV(A) lauroyltransferase